MTISSVIRNPMVSRISEMRRQLDDLQRQLTTGEKSETFGGLGSGRSQSISFRSRINEIGSYSSSISTVNLRISLLDSAMTRLDAIPTDVRAALDPNTYQVRLNGQTDGQSTAAMALNEMVSLLNSQADGRYLMSGKTTDTKPVVSVDEMLNGSDGKAGLKQVIAERWQADRGVGSDADGYMGRLAMGEGSSTVTLAPTASASAGKFSFAITGLSASSDPGAVTTNTVADGSGGVASASVAFGSGVKDGDTVTVDLAQPDGTTASITLTASSAASPGDGYFSIGDDAATTGANFLAALQAKVSAETDTSGNSGELDLGGTSSVSLLRQTPLSDEFGFKIAGVTSSSNRITASTTSSSGTVTGADVSFSDSVTDGDNVSVELTNPDGTTTTVTLTATNSTTPSDGYFSIGGNGAETGANFQAALETAIKTKTETDLRAASAMRASETFFDTFGGKTAARVDTSASGGDLATATGLTYDTAGTTVQWYQGYNAAVDTSDPSTLPRADVSARIDTGLTANYGVRANEAGYAKMMAALGVMASETFDSSKDTDEARYGALTERARSTLAFDDGTDSPSGIHSEIAVVGQLATEVGDRQTAVKSTYQELLDGVEGVDKNEIAAQILTLQNSLEASYQTTSMLGQLSLVNYM